MGKAEETLIIEVSLIQDSAVSSGMEVKNLRVTPATAGTQRV